MDGTEPITRIANATNRGDEQPNSAGKCGQIYGAPSTSNNGTSRADQEYR